MNPIADPPRLRAFRAEILHFLDDPATGGAGAAIHFPDGLLLVRDGRVAALGRASEILPGLPAGTHVDDWRGRLIAPGFIDTHVHYAQTDAIASPDGPLLDWLSRRIFPEEARFADPRHADEVAMFCVDELLRNGTTTALAYCTTHAASVDALFAAAARRRLRLITGKVLMDRNCPAALRDGLDLGEAESVALIERWHGRDRLAYAVTPRFAGTSGERQLELAGRLWRHAEGLYLQTHLAESRDEVDWIARLYPWAKTYLDVYDRFGLIGERAVYAHCIWLDAEERRRLAEGGAAAAFCPSANLFLGSGLFDLDAADRAGSRTGLGTDVGAGTSFSLLRTMAAAYQVLQLQGQTLDPLRAFYLATLGGARALYLDRVVGNLAVGKEADFVVLDPNATPLMARRMARAESIGERLGVWMILGDERAVSATFVLGEPAYVRHS